MSDPTAAEAVAQAMVRQMRPGTKLNDDARAVCAALGIDPDSPLSLLHWHATQQEQERCAELLERLAVANPYVEGTLLQAADQIRRSDRL